MDEETEVGIFPIWDGMPVGHPANPAQSLHMQKDIVQTSPEMWRGRVDGVESLRKKTERLTPNHSLSQ